MAVSVVRGLVRDVVEVAAAQVRERSAPPVHLEPRGPEEQVVQLAQRALVLLALAVEGLQPAPGVRIHHGCGLRSQHDRRAHASFASPEPLFLPK
jgi:hypothetical protein